jgi:hypothetical protein
MPIVKVSPHNRLAAGSSPAGSTTQSCAILFRRSQPTLPRAEVHDAGAEPVPTWSSPFVHVAGVSARLSGGGGADVTGPVECGRALGGIAVLRRVVTLRGLAALRALAALR